MKKSQFVLLVASAITPIAFAADPGQPKPAKVNHSEEATAWKPAEIFSVCKGRSIGGDAQLTTPYGHVIKGKCQAMLMPTELLSQSKAARPRGFLPLPPPELLSICKSLAIGSTAEIVMPDGQAMKGTCQLALMPEHPPGPPAEAFAACKNQTIGSNAQFVAPNGQRVKGQCKLLLIPEGPATLPMPPGK